MLRFQTARSSVCSAIQTNVYNAAIRTNAWFSGDFVLAEHLRDQPATPVPHLPVVSAAEQCFFSFSSRFAVSWSGRREPPAAAAIVGAAQRDERRGIAAEYALFLLVTFSARVACNRQRRVRLNYRSVFLNIAVPFLSCVADILERHILSFAYPISSTELRQLLLLERQLRLCSWLSVSTLIHADATGCWCTSLGAELQSAPGWLSCDHHRVNNLPLSRVFHGRPECSLYPALRSGAGWRPLLLRAGIQRSLKSRAVSAAHLAAQAVLQ